MKLGVYIRDRDRPCNGMRVLNGLDQQMYILGRYQKDGSRPDIRFYDGRISQRHAVLRYEEVGLWTITDTSRNGSYYVRKNIRSKMVKGDAIAIEDDDAIELCGKPYSVVFKTDLQETVEHNGTEDLLDESAATDQEASQPFNQLLLKELTSLYRQAGPLERGIMLVITGMVAGILGFHFLNTLLLN